MMRETLTPKQALFVMEYIVDFNGTKAAERSGYSPESAQSISTDLLQKPYILKAIQKHINYRVERLQITGDYVLAGFREVAERCLQQKPVMYYDKETQSYEQDTCSVTHEDGSITEEGVWEFDSAGANKALESLAKYLKLFEDKTIIDNSVHHHYTMIHKLHERKSEPAILRVD